MGKFGWDQCCAIYDSLKCNSCLCSFEGAESGEFFFELFIDLDNQEVSVGCASSDDDDNFLEKELLLLEIARSIGKTYIRAVSHYGTICSTVLKFGEYIESTWEKWISRVSASRDAFVCVVLIKALATNFYLLNSSFAHSQIEKLIKVAVTEVIDTTDTELFSLLKNILLYKPKETYACQPDVTTMLEKLKLHCPSSVSIKQVSVNEIKYHCCLALSHQWDVNVDKVFEVGMAKGLRKTLADVLELWQTVTVVITTQQHSNLFPTFLNTAHMRHFYGLVHLMDSKLLDAYMEVVLQMLASKANDLNWHMEETLQESFFKFSTEETLESLVADSGCWGFCGHLSEQPQTEDSHLVDKNWNLVGNASFLRRIVHVTFALMSGLTDVPSVCTVFHQVENVVLKRTLSAFHLPAHKWIPNLFVHQDDLLLGTMFSLLKLYLNLGLHLEINSCSDAETLKVCLNPHKLFLEFLTMIGGDHNVLLDFLMSNETCILPYMLHYFKLVLIEWQRFVEAHEELNYRGHTCEDSQENEDQTSDENDHCAGVYSTSAISDSVGAKIDEAWAYWPPHFKNPINPSASEVSVEHEIGNQCRNRLVSYSSSDSEELFCESETLDTAKKVLVNPVVKRDVNRTVGVIKNLREAIEILTEQKQFPYNAKPLLELMQKCETKHKDVNIVETVEYCITQPM